MEPVEIPFESLSREALEGVIDNFIQREGTDYGASEVSYETKMAQVRHQIERGEVVIVFDPSTESVMLFTKQEWKQQKQNSMQKEPDRFHE